MLQAFAIRYFPALTELLGLRRSLDLIQFAIRLGLPIRLAAVRVPGASR